MSMFDFTIDEHVDTIVPEGYYSRAQYRDATREEMLLWWRVRELEGAIERMRAPEVREVLDVVRGSEEDEVMVTAMEFALLRAHAPDVVTMEIDPSRVRERLLGYVNFYRDGSPARRYLRIASRGELSR
jgi:hypothetical protein